RVLHDEGAARPRARRTAGDEPRGQESREPEMGPQRIRPSPGNRRWADVGRDKEAVVATVPSPEGQCGGASGEVSWLRALARLPGCPVALWSEVASCPLQWRGLGRIWPGSDNLPSREMVVWRWAS